MAHHSKFPLLALLTLVCVAGSGCKAINPLNTDPQKSEDILRESTEYGAKVELRSGDIISCDAVSIRKDSTRWRLDDKSAEVVMPTDSVISVEVDNHKEIVPELIGGLIGGTVGGLIGYQIANAANQRDPSLNNVGNVIGDFLLPLALGLDVGVFVGFESSGWADTIWTRDRGIIVQDTAAKTVIPVVDTSRAASDTTTQMVIPVVDTTRAVPDTRIKKWVPDGFSTGFSHSGHWVYISNDSLHAIDTIQTKLPH